MGRWVWKVGVDGEEWRPWRWRGADGRRQLDTYDLDSGLAVHFGADMVMKYCLMVFFIFREAPDWPRYMGCSSTMDRESKQDKGIFLSCSKELAFLC